MVTVCILSLNTNLAKIKFKMLQFLQMCSLWTDARAERTHGTSPQLVYGSVLGVGFLFVSIVYLLLKE